MRGDMREYCWPRRMARRLERVTDAYSAGLSARMARSGKYRSPVTCDGRPERVRHRCRDHRVRLLRGDLGPRYRPPRDLYRRTASCALRALHSPDRVPATDSDLTSATTRCHSASLLRRATDIWFLLAAYK